MTGDDSDTLEQSRSLKLIRTERSHVQIPIFDYLDPEISWIVKKGYNYSLMYYYYTVFLVERSSWLNTKIIFTMLKKYFMFLVFL